MFTFNNYLYNKYIFHHAFFKQILSYIHCFSEISMQKFSCFHDQIYKIPSVFNDKSGSSSISCYFEYTESLFYNYTTTFRSTIFIFY